MYARCTQLVSIESLRAVEYLNDLFRLISIGQREVPWRQIWRARVKLCQNGCFRSIFYVFLTRGISDSCTLLVRITYETKLIEELGTRT